MNLVLLCYAKYVINLWGTSQGIGCYHAYTVERDQRLQLEIREQIKL
jgi:hypothetical protein